MDGLRRWKTRKRSRAWDGGRVLRGRNLRKGREEPRGRGRQTEMSGRTAPLTAGTLHPLALAGQAVIFGAGRAGSTPLRRSDRTQRTPAIPRGTSKRVFGVRCATRAGGG